MESSGRRNTCNRPSTCGAITFRVNTFHHSQCLNLFGVNTPSSLCPILIAAAVYFEYLAAAFHGMTPFEGFDYRELFSESDIKRAVVNSKGQCNNL
jgi:hypothetical protein